MAGVFAALGAALLAATEVFAFIMGFDGVVFVPFSTAFDVFAGIALLTGLGVGVWVFRHVLRIEKVLAEPAVNA